MYNNVCIYSGTVCSRTRLSTTLDSVIKLLCVDRVELIIMCLICRAVCIVVLGAVHGAGTSACVQYIELHE